LQIDASVHRLSIRILPFTLVYITGFGFPWFVPAQGPVLASYINAITDVLFGRNLAGSLTALLSLVVEVNN
jgi:hypothetical protein